MSDEFRPGGPVDNPCNPLKAQLQEQLQQRWGAWIDQRVLAAMAEATKNVAEAIGEVIARERARSRAEVEEMFAVARTETKLAVADAKVAVLEHVGIRIDSRFASMEREIINGLTIRDDAGVVLRRLPAPSSTRQ
jgi:hypothetical protein